MLRYPGLHRFAIYWGVFTERLSLLVEDHLRQQLCDISMPDMDVRAVAQLVLNSKYVAYHNEPQSYQMEDYIDDKLKLSFGTLTNLMLKQEIRLGSKPARPADSLYLLFSTLSMNEQNKEHCNKSHTAQPEARINMAESIEPRLGKKNDKPNEPKGKARL